MENNNINEVMKSLSELYAKKDYKKALEMLEQSSQLFDSGTYHYNLGTVHAKMGQFAVARFHYEKAIKDGYRSEALLNNLSYTKSKVSIDDLSNSDVPMDRVLDAGSIMPMTYFILLASMIFFIGNIWMYWNKSYRWWKLTILAILALSPIIFKVSFVDTKPLAIALKDAALFEGPSSIFEQKGEIKAGAKVRIGKINDKWIYIVSPQSLVGWTEKDKLGIY